MKKENLAKSFTHLVSDVNERLDELGDEGLTDPFESIYAIVFRKFFSCHTFPSSQVPPLTLCLPTIDAELTMRTVGCKDVAEDRILLDKMMYLYEQVESSATATALLFPWFPGQAKIRKTIAGAKIYFIFKKIVDARRLDGKTEDVSFSHILESLVSWFTD